MSITKVYMDLLKKKTPKQDIAIELYNYCSKRKTVWKSVYYILAVIVIVLTLSYNFANVYFGGDQKYFEFLHNISAITFVVSIIQALLMLILPFRTWQKYEKLEFNLSSAFSEYDLLSKYETDDKAKQTLDNQLGKALRDIVLSDRDMNEAIANASEEYLKKNGHVK